MHDLVRFANDIGCVNISGGGVDGYLAGNE